MNFTLHELVNSANKVLATRLTAPEGYVDEYSGYILANPFAGVAYQLFNDKQIVFRWALDELGLQEILHPVYCLEEEYIGAVFFGDFKLEFVNFEGYVHTNLFQLYRNNNYAVLDDGTPYDMLDDEVAIPMRRTLDRFQKGVEENIIALLNAVDNGALIRYALTPTIPGDWYPGDKAKYMRKINNMH